MKITEVRAAGLRGGTPKGGWSNELQADDCSHTLILVATDEGVFGLGSVFTNDALVKASLAILSELLVGENALEPERVSEKLRQNTFWQGRGGAIEHTISGIDIALWDILGKATGQPVGRLLGGRYRDRVRPYASILMEEPAALREKLVAIKEHNFHAFKIGWGPFGRSSSRLDEEIVRAARDAIGPEDLLAVDPGGSDAFWSQGYKWALRTAEMLAAYDVAWLEEALRPDAMADYIELRRRSPVPISGGEVFTRRQTFLSWLQSGAFDIVQPDATKVGGLSESRRIAWTAEENGVRLIPHGWNTAVGLASDLQLASAVSGTNMVEYLIGSPYIDEITARPWQLDAEGYLSIPGRPGLGVDLDSEAVARYTGDRSFLEGATS